MNEEAEGRIETLDWAGQQSTPSFLAWPNSFLPQVANLTKIGHHLAVV
jgi:hypothetical protein